MFSIEDNGTWYPHLLNCLMSCGQNSNVLTLKKSVKNNKLISFAPNVFMSLEGVILVGRLLCCTVIF